MLLKTFVLLEWDDVGSQNVVHLVNNYTSQQTGGYTTSSIIAFCVQKKILHRHYDF